jgi:dihydroorotate dehydrogenase
MRSFVNCTLQQTLNCNHTNKDKMGGTSGTYVGRYAQKVLVRNKKDRDHIKYLDFYEMVILKVPEN